MSLQELAGAPGIGAALPGLARLGHHRAERVQARHDEVLGPGPAGLGTMELDQQVQGCPPVAGPGELAACAGRGAGEIRVGRQGVTARQPRHDLPARRGNRGNDERQARLGAQRQCSGKGAAEPAECGVGRILPRAQPGCQVVDSGEHPAAAGIGGQPVMTAEPHRLVLQRRRGESPAVPQRPGQDSLRQVIGTGEHAPTLPATGRRHPSCGRPSRQASLPRTPGSTLIADCLRPGIGSLATWPGAGRSPGVPRRAG